MLASTLGPSRIPNLSTSYDLCDMLTACSSCPGRSRPSATVSSASIHPAPRQMSTLHEYAVIDQIEGLRSAHARRSNYCLMVRYFQRNWAFRMNWHGILGQSRQFWGVNTCKLFSKTFWCIAPNVSHDIILMLAKTPSRNVPRVNVLPTIHHYDCCLVANPSNNCPT
jgi:hypothetical protein